MKEKKTLKLTKPFYLNIVFPYGTADGYIPCWYDKWAGSIVRSKAAKMRFERKWK